MTDHKSVSTIIKMVGVAMKYLDFTKMNPIYKTARVTPTKVTNRLNNLMGNYRSFVVTIKECVQICLEMMPKVSNDLSIV